MTKLTIGRKPSIQTALSNAVNGGWHTWLFPIEVDVRGFCSQSVCRLMPAVGTNGTERHKVTQRLNKAAERASS